MGPFKFLTKSFSFKLGNLDISPQYWHAIAIVILLFLLVLTLARLRYLYVHWSLQKPSIAMIFWGFLLALILEGFLLISGRTLFTEILGWKNAPKPISIALDAGRAKLVKVLGVTEEIPSSLANESPSYSSVMSDFQKLSEEEKQELRLLMCSP